MSAHASLQNFLPSRSTFVSWQPHPRCWHVIGELLRRGTKQFACQSVGAIENRHGFRTLEHEMAIRASSGDSRSVSARRPRQRRSSSDALLDAFFATLEDAPARALIVDYDGT